MFDKELRLAIRRWEAQKASVKECETSLAEAQKQRLIYTVKRLQDKLPRLQGLVHASAAIVSELQKAKR